MGANKYSASGKTDYETPQDRFDEWNKIFRFNLDVACNASNWKVETRIQYPEYDAFSRNWKSSIFEGRVWLNPPYGREITKWITRAIQQVDEGYAEFVLMLLPANTDTKWFHNLCKKHGKITFLPGRITFVGEVNPQKNGSMLVLFGKDPTVLKSKMVGGEATLLWEWDMLPSEG